MSKIMHKNIEVVTVGFENYKKIKIYILQVEGSIQNIDTNGVI